MKQKLFCMLLMATLGVTLVHSAAFAADDGTTGGVPNEIIAATMGQTEAGEPSAETPSATPTPTPTVTASESPAAAETASPVVTLTATPSVTPTEKAAEQKSAAPQTAGAQPSTDVNASTETSESAQTGSGEHDGQEKNAETAVCSCDTPCAEGEMNAECPVCGGEGAKPTKCAKYNAPEEKPQATSDTTPKPTPAPDDTPAPLTVQEIQELINALPSEEEITEENRAEVEEQLTAIDDAKLNLTDEEFDELDFTSYQAAIAALEKLDGEEGASEPVTLGENSTEGIMVAGYGGTVIYKRYLQSSAPIEEDGNDIIKWSSQAPKIDKYECKTNINDNGNNEHVITIKGNPDVASGEYEFAYAKIIKDEYKTSLKVLSLKEAKDSGKIKYNAINLIRYGADKKTPKAGVSYGLYVDNLNGTAIGTYTTGADGKIIIDLSELAAGYLPQKSTDNRSYYLREESSVAVWKLTAKGELSTEKDVTDKLIMTFSEVSNEVIKATIESSYNKESSTLTVNDVSYTVTWDANGGKLGTEGKKSKTLPAGSSITPPSPNPTKEGNAEYSYAFAGWLNEDGTLVTQFGQADRNKSYTAKWTETKNSYTLKFHSNGGTDIAPVTKPYGTVIDVSKSTPTRYGCLFTGWYTDTTFTTRVSALTLTGDTTLYAGWVSNPYVGVHTGDEAQPALWAALAGVSALGLIIGAIVYKKKKSKKQ